jgi:hypothetical protein
LSSSIPPLPLSLAELPLSLSPSSIPPPLLFPSPSSILLPPLSPSPSSLSVAGGSQEGRSQLEEEPSHFTAALPAAAAAIGTCSPKGERERNEEEGLD